MRMKHGSDRRPTISVKPRLLAAFTAVAMMFATAVPALMPQTAVADPEVEGAICTPQDISMGDNTSDSEKDDGIATWVGRDMYVGSPQGKTSFGAGQAPDKSYAVEAEGTTLVGGKLAINSTKNSWNQRGFRFGIVGFGAQYRPDSGDSLVVGGGSDSNITLTDSSGTSTNVLGWGQLGRGWIGTTSSAEKEYNAKIAGPESTVMAPVASTSIYLKNTNTSADPPYIHAWYQGGEDITDWNSRPRMYRITNEWVAYTFPTTARIGFQFDNGSRFFTYGTNLAWTVDNGQLTATTPSAVKSLYSTSSGSTIAWNQPNPLTQVVLNGNAPKDYSKNTETIKQLSDTLGAIPQAETSKVQVNQTAPDALNYGYTRQKYNSGQPHPATGSSDAYTSPYIGVKMTFNDSNYKEKMIVFDGGGENNQNSTIVFNVNATDLNSNDANGLVFKFQNIKQGASVVVNVKGNQNVEFHNGWRFWWNGEEIGNGYYHDATDKQKRGYEQASQAILWNFQNTPKLTIRGGMLRDGQALRWANIDDKGTSGGVKDVPVTVDDDPAAAMIGSILVPRGSFEDHVTTNGRVWVGEDFMMYNPTMAADFPSGIGEGPSSSVIDMDQERHNFPWKGSMRSECSTISWNKVDEQGNLLEGSTWGVYKSKQDAIDEQNALYPSVKDNDIPSGDWNPTAGKFRVDSLEPNARYFLKELTAPAGYEKSDLIYVIKTTEKGDVSNKDIIAVYNADGSENKNPDSWKLANVVGETDTKGIANSPEGGMIQWGKYEDGKDKTGLPGSVWKLTKTGEGDWTQEITDNTKAVEGIALYNGNDDVTNGSLTVTEGTTLQLTHRVSPDDATQDVTWESSDPTAAEVQNGHVTVLHVPADGQPVTITATTVDTNASGDRLSAHVALTIQEVALNSLTLKYNGQTDPSEISTTVGNNITLTATADPPSLQSSITWDSTDKTVATVENGVVTPHEAGSTTIWAKCKDDQSKWKSVDINVTNPVANTTTVYVHWLNASTAPRIHYWDSNNEGSTWGTRPTMETASCAGNDWYKYDVPFAGKPFNVKVTMGNDNNVYKVNGSADIPIAGTARAYNIDGGKVNSSAPAGCVTRAAVPSQAANDAELTLAPKSDATDEASIQTFRRARLNTMAESQPGANATTQYKDSNSMVGQFTILGLPDGEYTLTEKTAPSGYLLNTTVYTFTMSGGKVTWTGDKQPSIVGDMAWISDKPTQVVWEKVDSDNNNAPLAGSGWTIEQKSIVDGQEKWTPINEVMDCTEAPCNALVQYKDEDPTPGKFLVKKLPVGTYRITETTVPDGYEAVGGPYEFTVTDREETVRVNGKPLGNTRKKGKVYWGKVSSEDDTRFLAGSAWKVTYIPYGKTEADKVEVDITDCVQSDGSSTGTCSAADATKAPWAYDAYGAEGRIGFDNLPWGSYEMIETKAPDGYYADPDVSYVFSVGPDTPDDQFQNLVIYKKDTATGATTPLPNYPNQVISNEPGVVLPATGGEGNTLIVLFGFALIAISMLGCGVVMRKRI
ncbi:SpaA isopeptide-forming pilin-related protein [Bifidobacterium pseudolongum]|uniref:SpaA isopeptide-forming pilin-related protein n=1 Tax=Bifidobacterium pseudolongum TaxID=1694 RepID=UPI0010E73F52|nr:SpaA isopeptide-forming pilin-related protein [Bifidobacterium pseudolongum]RYQ53954.1 Bacterial Ig-like domain (group 2) [Bifidobacterium pseudolongum subsp. pseudolongum]